MKKVIAFCGAAGVGKTTLVNSLMKECLKRDLTVGVIGEVARSVFEKYANEFDVKTLDELRQRNLSLYFQYDVLQKQIQFENMLNAEYDYDLVLSDRSVLDNMMYFLVWCRRNDDPEIFDRYIDTVYRRVFIEKFYKVLVVVPPFSEKLVDDGFRTFDLEYRKAQEQLMDMLVGAAPNVIVLQSTELDKRAKEVLSYLTVEGYFMPKISYQFTALCCRCGKEVEYQDTVCVADHYLCQECSKKVSFLSEECLV